MLKKVSIIVPVYNVEKYLGQCLDSLLNQTFKDVEIICVNDGSTDSSSHILNKYARADNRIVVVNQQNMGLSVARNVGLELAQGEYVAFIDSDDYLNCDDYLEKMVNACDKYNADISVAGIVRGNEKKKRSILNISDFEIIHDYSQKLRICDVPNSCHVWNKLYKRSALKATGIIFPPHTVYEDLYYTYKVLYYLDKLVSVPDVSYFYRKRPNSIIKQKSKKNESDAKIGHELMYKFLEEHGIDVSAYVSKTKKYKLFGLTFFKTITKNNKRNNILFNFIRWQT